jgi:hypothetical protein
MSFAITDSTAGVQRFAVNNSGNTELGSGTPSGPLSINGHPVLSGAVLAQMTAAPASMPRITGSASVANGGVVVVNVSATTSGLATVDGPGVVVGYNSGRTQVTLACTNTTSGTSSLNYGSF